MQNKTLVKKKLLVQICFFYYDFRTENQIKNF